MNGNLVRYVIVCGIIAVTAVGIGLFFSWYYGRRERRLQRRAVKHSQELRDE